MMTKQAMTKTTRMSSRLQIVITTDGSDARVFANTVSAPRSDVAQAVSEAMKAFNQTFTASLAKAKRVHARAFVKGSRTRKAA